MKRTRLARGAAAAPRVLRRKNIVHDEDESEEEDARMSGDGAEDDEEEEGDEEEEEEEEEDDEEEDDDEEEEEEEEEEEANQTQRRRTSDRIKSATPPPKKKLRRGAQAKRGNAEEEEEEEEDKKGNEDGDEEEEEEEENKSDSAGRKRMPRRAAAAAAAAPPRRNERPTPKRGAARRNKVEEEEEEDEEEEEEDAEQKKKDDKGKSTAVESEEQKQEEEDEDTGTLSSAAATPMDVDNDDMEETKSEGTPLVTPSSSPVRRSGLSINTLMNSATSTPTKKSDRKSDEVPFQHLRDRLRSAASEPELLEVITSACSSLIKDGKAPNRLFSVALLSAVKENPSRFLQPALLKYLLRLLRSKHYLSTGKDSTSGASDMHGALKKTGSSSSITSSISTESVAEMPLPVVIANILQLILKDAEKWPEDSFKVFLDDSLHGRVWVDHEFSSTFVRNVKSMIRSPEEISREANQQSALVRPRFIEGKDRVELRELAMKHIRLRLNELEKERSAMTKVIRPMVLALIDFVSIPEARVIAAENLDTWLQNPATKGPAKDLLNKVVSHCKTMDTSDVRAVDLLFKLKLKPTMFQVKVETITQLVRQHEGYMRLALNLFISRERPNNMGKDVDNMKMLQQIFRASRTSASTGASSEDTFYTSPAIHPGALASRELGFVFRDLCSSSEVAPVLKTMVRKIVKQLAFDNVDMKTLCVEILKNDDHLDALDKYADMRLLDYTALVTGTVWLVLLMRGAAVKSLQIQQTNAAASGPRQEAGPVQLGGPSKLGGAQAIPRRAIQSVVAGGAAQAVRVSKHGGGFGKNKPPVAVSGKASPSSAGGSSTSSAVVAGGAQPDVTVSNKAVKLAVKAKEDLQQTLAHVQRQALIACHEIFHKFGLTGKSAFEKSLYESIVKKLLFLDIPPDVQPTEHDKTCFLSTKEDIPLHEDTLEMLTSLLSACESVDRVEALRTLEAVVFRAAEGHLNREELWGAAHGQDLATYSANGGILGIEVTRTTFVVDLLRLTVWKGEHKLEHEFCHSSRFWICCSILLIVGSFNPTTVGDFLWREIPTLRAIMQMLITGRFEFPSVSSATPDPELFGGHRENFSDLVHANNQLREYEQHVMATVASNVEDPLMLFEIQGVARQPPPAIIDHLKVLDRKFRLGTRLRQSRKKDFLMEMVAAGAGISATGSDSAGSDGSWWITDIVCEDFDTVQYLPYECLCRLLLLARRGPSLSSISSNGAKKARQLAQVVPRLQVKLHEFLVDPTQIEQGSKVVLYFLECLVSGAPRDRRVASQILVDLTRDEMEVESASSTPKSESDGTLDETASSTLPVMDGLNPLDTINATMNFEWLGALLKLPCYNQVRDDVFSALESLLDRESTVGSLSSCIKALHAFWKDACEQQQEDASSASSKSASKGRIPYSGAAADASVQLAGTFGRLLSTREFVCRHLLQQRDICEIICEIFWSVVALQLRHDASDRSGGIRFSDCKVFYATDGTSTVREIKLPLPVIHGAIRVLCATRYSPQGGSVAYEKLSDCLFPKVKKDSSTAILSSTGVIATKDRRLYPAHLLKTMVQHSSNPHLVAAAAKATPAETLWELVRATGLSDHALSCVTRALADLIKSNESIAVSSLQTASKMDSVEQAAADMARSVAITSPSKSSTDRNRDHERFVHDWISQKAEVAQRKESFVSDDEEALLSSGFTAFSVSSSKPKTQKPLFAISFDDDIGEDDSPMPSAPASVDAVESDWNTLARIYPTAKIKSNESPRASSGFSSKAVGLVLGSCVRDGGVVEHQDGSSSWSRRIALLHCIRSACHSSSGAARLGEAVVQVVEHVAGCESDSCATECCDFVKQACAMVSESYSQSASYCFVEQATRITDVGSSHESQKSTRAVLALLSTLLSCVDAVTLGWAKTKYAPKLSPLLLHNVVALVIEVEILARSSPSKLRGIVNETQDNVVVLLRIVESIGGGDATGLVFILESILSASASIVSAQDYLAHHQDVRRELIEALYFSYPRAVSAHLDVLDPSWKWTTNPLSKSRLYLKKAPAEAVAAAVSDLKREVVDAVDRLRELSIREPVLVQNGLLSLLQEWKGDMSLTLLYQKSGVFQQIIRVTDMIVPFFVEDDKAVEAVLEFVFEIIDTIVRHQAAEFYQLVARILAFLADSLAREHGGFASALFKADRLESLRAVTAIYESVAEIASFAGVLDDAHNKHHVKDALLVLEAARNKTVASSEDQRVVRSFLERLKASPVVVDAAAAVEIETSLQLLLQILNKAQELGTRVPLLAHCAEAVAPLLEQPNMTKSAMKTLCQVLLALIKHDPTDSVSVVAPHYLRCLTSLRIALRECVLVYIADFLALTDVPQRRAILERLYDDFSDVAKSKLMAFVKSPAFKTSYEDHGLLY